MADEIGDYIAKISQEFTPMDLGRLPEEIREAISSAGQDQVPVMTPVEVEQVILGVNINKGKTKGDIPPALYKSGIRQLKEPIATIFNSVTRSGIWPSR